MKNDSRYCRRAFVLALLTACTLAFIWINSSRSVSDSAAMSDEAYSFLTRLFGPWPFSFDIRKAAHVVEFALLGFSLALRMILLPNRGLQSAINAASIALFAAVTDESIQILSGRGDQVSDILLDFSAFAVSFFVIWGSGRLIVCLLAKASGHK